MRLVLFLEMPASDHCREWRHAEWFLNNKFSDGTNEEDSWKVETDKETGRQELNRKIEYKHKQWCWMIHIACAQYRGEPRINNNRNPHSTECQIMNCKIYYKPNIRIAHIECYLDIAYHLDRSKEKRDERKETLSSLTPLLSLTNCRKKKTILFLLNTSDISRCK